MFQLDTLKNLLTFVVLMAIISLAPRVSTAAPPLENFSSIQPELFIKCWDYRSSPDLTKGVAANDSSFYFLDTDGKLESVDLALATKRWSTELGGEMVSNILLAHTAVFVVTVTPTRESTGNRKVFLRSLSQQTGITNWNREIASSSRISLGTINGNIIAVGGDGDVAGYSSNDGTRLWTRQLGSNVTTEAYFGVKELVLGTGKKELLAINGQDGQTQILSTFGQVPSAVLVGPGARYLVGDERGNLISASSSGSRWRFKNGARISFVMSFDSEYLASSFDNFIYKLSRGGNVEWKRRLSGRVANRPLIINDAAIVSTVGDGSVYIIDLTNGKVLNRIETGDESTAGVARTGRTGEFIISTGKGFSAYSHEKCPLK